MPQRSRLALPALALVLLVPSAEAERPSRRATQSGPRLNPKGVKETRLSETRRIDPEDAAATEAMTHMHFANQFLQKGMTAQARAEIEKALSVQPAFPEASYLYACILYEQNDYRGSLGQAQNALEQNPMLTEAHNIRGMAFGKMGDSESALKEFEAVKADPSYPTPEVAHFNIGKVFADRQACGEAVLHFRRALEINQQFWRAWYQLGLCQEMLGQREPARQSFIKATEIAPDQTEPAYHLGLACFQLNDFACARSWFQKVLEQAPSSDLATQSRDYLRQMNFR